MKKYINLFSILSLGIVVMCFKPTCFTGKVIRVKDGDTFVAQVNGEYVTIRLAELDAPELHQNFGQAAKIFAEQQILNKEVKIVETDKDKYGRLIAQVYVGNIWLNELIVKNGYGWHYEHFKHDPQLKKDQQEARQKHLGLWQETNPIPPFKFRKDHS